MLGVCGDDAHQAASTALSVVAGQGGAVGRQRSGRSACVLACAVSPALAVDGSRFAWDIGNDRTSKTDFFL